MPLPWCYRRGTEVVYPGAGEGAHIPLHTQRQVQPADQREPGPPSGSVSPGRRHQLQAGNQASHLPGKCSVLQGTALKGPLILCNRPVKPHCLFAHHTTQKSERDVETLSAAVGCNPTVWELLVWATNVEVGISTGTAFISLDYTWKAQLRLSCSTKNPAQVGRI